jgi:hypothetical protein
MGQIESSGILLGKGFEFVVLFKAMLAVEYSLYDLVLLSLVCQDAAAWVRIQIRQCTVDMIRDAWIRKGPCTYLEAPRTRIGAVKTRAEDIVPGRLAWHRHYCNTATGFKYQEGALCLAEKRTGPLRGTDGDEVMQCRVLIGDQLQPNFSGRFKSCFRFEAYPLFDNVIRSIIEEGEDQLRIKRMRLK